MDTNTLTRAETADATLRRLFVPGRPAPSPEQIDAAYPFGARVHWPLAVWNRRVYTWRKAHALGRYPEASGQARDAGDFRFRDETRRRRP